MPTPDDQAGSLDAARPRPAQSKDRPTVRLTREEALANRETVRLPRQRPPGRTPAGAAPVRRAPIALAAAVTTVWAAIVSLAPMLGILALIRLIDGVGASVGGALRLSLASWLLAHGVPIQIGSGLIAVPPLALSALAAWRVFRAGVHTARALGARRTRRIGQALGAGAAVAVCYGLLGAAAAAGAGAPPVSVSPVRAGWGLALFGLVAGVAGALREAGAVERLADRTPGVLRDGIRTGVVAAFLLLGAGAALAGLAVAVRGRDVAEIMRDYHTGVAGQTGLTLVCLLYAPNLAVWSASYLIGPGFVIGADTSISPAYVAIGPSPGLPILGGLPSAPVSGPAGLLLGVPLAAALAAGWLLARRRLRGPDPSGAATAGQVGPADLPALLGAAVFAGLVSCGLLGLASIASGGSLGQARMADVGPPPWPVARTTAVVVLVGAALGVAATKFLTRRAPR
jgi:hypothetical protein